jgi:hypothetical protein
LVLDVVTVATNVKVEPTATVADGTLSVTAFAGVVEALPLPQPATPLHSLPPSKQFAQMFLPLGAAGKFKLKSPADCETQRL